MKTVTDNFQEMADEIRGMLQTLLLDHSALYQWNHPSDSVIVIDPYGDFAYQELQEPGRQVQSKLLEEYRRFSSLLKTLMREAPTDSLGRFSEAEAVILRTIEQQHTWCKTTQKALDVATEALETELNFLKNLYDPIMGDVFYVPDTNALLHNPYLEKWKFDRVSSFTLVITPTILSELDVLKINHRNETVREKADGLVNRMKEFRRRGRLTDGVILVKGKSNVSTIATEPNMQASLPWLDPANNDDRFLASVIEVMRLRPRSFVLAVSRDINLQNKAEFARIPFTEPPEPAPPRMSHSKPRH